MRLSKKDKNQNNVLDLPSSSINDSNNNNNISTPVDLRAEHDEPVENSVRLMDYLLT